MHFKIMSKIIEPVNWVTGIILIMFSCIVTIPLTIKTFFDGGGIWGFGVIGVPILLPLSAYILFGIAGVVKDEVIQNKVFVAAHAVTLTIGIVSLLVFPLYPIPFILIPVTLAALGIVNKTYYKYYLVIMILLAVVANILLLKWEMDFGRSLPIIQLFQSSNSVLP